MARLYFTNKAIEDLEAIWKYPVKTWSENQAEIYYSTYQFLLKISY